MKHCISLLLVLCLTVAVCGCRGKTGGAGIAAAEPGYSCSTHVTYGDLEADALVRVVGGGLFTIEMLSPDELNGIAFSFDNGNMTIQHGSQKFDTNTVGQYGGFAELLNAVFMKLSTGNPVVVRSGDDYRYTGQTDGSTYTVTLNDKGFPVSISIPNAKLSATFSNWMY